MKPPQHNRHFLGRKWIATNWEKSCYTPLNSTRQYYSIESVNLYIHFFARKIAILKSHAPCRIFPEALRDFSFLRFLTSTSRVGGLWGFARRKLSATNSNPSNFYWIENWHKNKRTTFFDLPEFWWRQTFKRWNSMTGLAQNCGQIFSRWLIPCQISEAITQPKYNSQHVVSQMLCTEKQTKT